MKFLKTLVISALAVYAIMVVAIYFAQDRIIYVPKKLDPSYDFKFTSSFKEKSLQSSYGTSINYLVFTPPKPPSRVILYFHGNAGALDSWGFVAEELAIKTNSEVWIFDYPGYGKSGDKLAQSGAELVSIGLEFLNTIKKTRIELPVFLYGRSLGTGIASETAISNNVDGIILETPYIDTKSIAKDLLPIAPSFILKVKLDNKLLKKSDQKNILLIHGTNDELISYGHSAYLHEILKDKASLITIKGASHNNLSNFPLYWQGLKNYFN